MGRSATIQTIYNMPEVRRAVGRSHSAETYRAGRLIYSDFTNSTLDAAIFTMTGFSRVTDGSTHAIQNTASNAQATLTTLISDFKDFDLRIKYKGVNDNPFGPNRAPCIFGRNVPGLGNWYLNNRMGASAANFSQLLPTNASNSVSYMQDANPADLTHYRYLRMQAVGSVARIKTWIEGTAEPGWTCVDSIHSDPSTGGLIPWQGGLGISSLYNTCFISEFRAIELLRHDDNLLCNAQAETAIQRDDSGNIIAQGLTIWDNSGQDGVFTIESVLDREGYSRPAFKVVRATAMGTESGLFNQTVVAGGGDVVYGGTRQLHNQQSALVEGNAVEISVWSKALNIASPVSPSAAMGSAIVLYQFDCNGTVLQWGSPYYCALNPFAAVNNQTGTGQGTWDWNETRVRCPIMPGAVHFAFSMGLHDVNTTGTLWLQDPVMRVVS